MKQKQNYFSQDLPKIFLLKDTHREKAPSNETQALSMNMNILVVGTLNQLFIRGSYTEVKFRKKKKK